MYRTVQRARSSRRPTIACRLTTGFLVVVACCWLLGQVLPARSQTPEISETTEFRVFTSDWWPTSGTASSEAYAGDHACQQCHAEVFSTQKTTPMANASYRSAVGAWGSAAPAVTTHLGGYVYRVLPQAGDSKLIVGSGNQFISADISWTFGAGVVGQTFVLASRGKLYDGEITSFRGLPGRMGISPAHRLPRAGDLESALGESMPPKTAARCFGCHTTASMVKEKFDPEHAIPGVTCESCHGPGLAHVVAASMNMIEDAKALIFSPRSLNPVESVDFCGACHTTSADVLQLNLFVPSNVRFPPYRLEKSRCWGVRGDQRLVCFACHDPHKPLVQEASFYDQRCLSCHSSTKQPPEPADSTPEVCPKATSHCTTCHMPKYYVPEMHGKFTDHFIRVVGPGEPYPVQ